MKQRRFPIVLDSELRSAPVRADTHCRKKALALRAADDDLVMDFPRHVELDLTEEQRAGMQYLVDHLPHEDDTLLLSQVLSRGIQLVEEESRHGLANSFKPFEEGSRIRARHDVPNYIGVPLAERLREKLQRFLDAHPDAIGEEQAAAMLLDLGLHSTELLPLAERDKDAKRAARCRQLRAIAGARRWCLLSGLPPCGSILRS